MTLHGSVEPDRRERLGPRRALDQPRYLEPEWDAAADGAQVGQRRGGVRRDVRGLPLRRHVDRRRRERAVEIRTDDDRRDRAVRE